MGCHFLHLLPSTSILLIGMSVPLRKVRLKQKTLKCHTMQPQHKGILLFCDIYTLRLLLQLSQMLAGETLRVNKMPSGSVLHHI